MTNEKAIQLLHRLSDEQFDGIHGDERREALSMAVRALFSQQIVNDSQGLVNDCISRKWLMECVNEGWIKFDTEKDKNIYVHLVRDIAPSAQLERPEQPESAKEYCAECNHIEMCRWYPYEGCEFRSLPSAQPETHDKRTETHACDLINRQQAIEAFEPEHHTDWYTPTIIKTIEELPQAQPDKSCKGCHFEKHGSRACDYCSRMYMDRYEVRNDG